MERLLELCRGAFERLELTNRKGRVAISVGVVFGLTGWAAGLAVDGIWTFSVGWVGAALSIKAGELAGERIRRHRSLRPLPVAIALKAPLTTEKSGAPSVVLLPPPRRHLEE
jgi:hypothetical protein